MLTAESAACYFCLLQLGTFKHGISSFLLGKVTLEVRLENAVVHYHVYNHIPAKQMQRSVILQLVNKYYF